MASQTTLYINIHKYLSELYFFKKKSRSRMDIYDQRFRSKFLSKKLAYVNFLKQYT